MHLFAIIFHETRQLTPVRYQLATNIALQIQQFKLFSSICSPVHQQKMRNDYVFRGIKCTCQNVS